MGIDNVIPIVVYALILAGAIYFWRRHFRNSRGGESKPDRAASQGQTYTDRREHTAPSEKSVQEEMHAIFISYRRDDSSDVTGRIYDRLVQHFGRESVFKDVDAIPLGVDFRKHLADSVGRCGVFLAVIGRNWRLGNRAHAESADNPHDFVRIEIESAFQRGIPVIPVLVQGAAVPNENELPPGLTALAYHNAISIRPDPDFHQDVGRLIKGIETHLQTRKSER